MATLYKVDRTEQEVSPKNGTDFQLDELYELIGCKLVEIIHLGEGYILVVDEEGAINGSELNVDVSYALGSQIFGNALYCKESEVR